LDFILFISTLRLSMNINLEQYAWDSFFADAKKASENGHLEHGRVLSVHKSKYEVVKSDGIFSCDIVGKLQFQKNPIHKPAVGDWVLIDRELDTFVILEVLARKSILKRQKKHDHFPKPIAANVDTAFVVQAIGSDFNIKRLNRILVHIHDAGIRPVVIINKIDLAKNGLDIVKAELKNLDQDIPVFFTSHKTGEGVSELEKMLVPRETIIFIGSSGVGKSSLINHLFGEEILETQKITKLTGKGKHTTTVRRLIKLKNGALLIDTPGTREFGMHGDDYDALEQQFYEIEKIASLCRFKNCSHKNEEGCAIREALENGSLDKDHYERYLVLEQELSQTAKQMRQGGKQSSKRRMKKYPTRSIRRGKQ